MTRRAPRGRSGITLTEILISILILGVGVVSLATLFPLGLIRMRNAQRLTRGGFLVESAMADLGVRNLLAQASFLNNPVVASWYFGSVSGQYNPFIQDTPSYGADWGPAATPAGVFRGDVSGSPPGGGPGPGLPVAYDPPWRTVTGIYPTGAVGTEARFGQGVGFGGAAGLVRDDPNPGSGPRTASAHGLQRVTNFDVSFLAQTVLKTFISPEDLVLQEAKGQYQDPNSAAGTFMGSPSTVVPDLSAVVAGTAAEPTVEWRYSWFFTCQQSDYSNATIFEGDIVLCENRPFGLDTTSSPFAAGSSVYQATGETTVEAVWGYTAAPDSNAPAYGSPSARRTVLLRWPASLPDPDVRVGGWIADVTYERDSRVIDPTKGNRFPYLYPAQRCYWYQVSKKSEVTASAQFVTGEIAYRQITVFVTTPLRAMSRMNFTVSPVVPYHVEAALVMPSVVNVYPRTVYTR